MPKSYSLCIILLQEKIIWHTDDIYLFLMFNCVMTNYTKKHLQYLTAVVNRKLT